MSAAALPTVPPPAPDDDAPPPRTPLRRWLLAAALSVPIAAAYGLVAMLLGRLMFLDPAAEAGLRDRVDGIAPLLLLWVLAAAAALGGLVFVVREVLDHRAARREGREPVLPVGTGPSWVWPAVFAASPVVALGGAALVAAATASLSDLEQGEPALIFAVLAGGWLSFMAAIGWALVALRRAKEDADPQPVEGIEDTWFQQAAAQSFWDVVIVLGLGTFVLSVWRVQPDANLVLLGLLLVAMVDFPVRLLLLKRREERA
ncbi:hypothetical protein Xcel_3239 [Xylanimonas cellulosilytica DSM 15894]|uniref:Uncharacterized protein n=1 Tax=Xylanimonas cellulosilytica (strain DSM 15894 / JCM 12276 / CECT 5975 / KCTC 9989 / LMG 20990 / NBRC 107835 / XIL07) TaxID=446471 RepID=D1C0N6_XYLCX|nr:hypothetical protein [Xylanimonas cellulosilytica]ACZ32239.1 hypothetical protein Xcel_3239 [Xylanimonas cellulosilytica DSM 15894]